MTRIVNRVPVSVVASLLALLFVSSAVASWHSGGGGGGAKITADGTISQWNIGGIICDTGAVVGADNTENNKDLRTTIGYGTKFDGTQYDNTASSISPTQRVVKHYFMKDPGTGSAENSLRVESQATPTTSGTATQNTGGTDWWWCTSVDNSQDSPNIMVYNSSTQSWEDGSGGVTEHAATFGHYTTTMPNPINPFPSQPATPSYGSSTSGEYRAALDLTGVERIKVEFPFTLSASGNVDNANVDEWMEYLDCTLGSKLSYSQPGTDWTFGSM